MFTPISRNSLGQLFSSLRRGHRRGRHKPHADRRWPPEVMRLEDRVVLAGVVSPTPIGLTPAQIRTAYGIDSISLGSVIGDGTGQTIAIVDFGDAPNFVNSTDPNFQTSDLAKFDKQFGLPDPPSFTKVNQNGVLVVSGNPLPPGLQPTTPSQNQETALDVEWAHAIAPKASIILVEANSFTNSDAATAFRTAASLPGVSVVSYSAGVPEFPGEVNFDSNFTTPPGHPNVTFVVATGDNGSTGTYPAFSPNVVAVGGTTLSLNPDNSYKSEVGWTGSEGGFSKFEPLPVYQKGVTPFNATNVNQTRMIPDVSFDGDVQNSGVAIYDSFTNGSNTPWSVSGGTSLGAPAWAALIATADQLRQSVNEAPLNSSQTLQMLYSLPSGAFHDVTTGSNLNYSAGPGYDLVTGLGSPVANLLVPDLVVGPPQVVGFQREGVHRQPTSLVLTINGSLDPVSAQDPANYVLAPHPDGRFGRRIALRSVTYNPLGQTVVLVPQRRLNLHQRFELVVNGTPPTGLASPIGIPLAGGNHVVIFRGFGAVDPKPARVHLTSTGHTGHGVGHQRI